MKKKIAALAAAAMLTLSGCSSASVASQNVSRDADEFRVNRRIVFVDTVTGDYLFEMTGVCSIGNSTANELAVICKTGENEYKKHFFGVTQTVSYVVEQLEPVKAGQYGYKIVFKPANVLPTIEVK